MIRSIPLAALLATSCLPSEGERRDLEYSFIFPPHEGAPGFGWRGPLMPRAMEVTWNEADRRVCRSFLLSRPCVSWVRQSEQVALDGFELVLNGPDGQPVDAILEARAPIMALDGWLEPGPYTLHAHLQGELVAEASFVISADGTGDSPHPLAEGAFDERYILSDMSLGGILPPEAFLVRLHEIDEGPGVSIYANVDLPDRLCRAYQGPITHEHGGYSHASAIGIEVGRDPTFYFETLDLQLAVNHDDTLSGIDLEIFGEVDPFALVLSKEDASEEEIARRKDMLCDDLWPPLVTCEPCAGDPDTECIQITLIHGLAERTDEFMDLDEAGPCTAPGTGNMACSVVGTGLVGGWGLGLVLLLLRRKRQGLPDGSVAPTSNTRASGATPPG